MQASTRHQAGFTLLELLIALSIFAVLSVMSYGALNSTLRSREATQEASQALSELQMGLLMLERDLSQAVDRPVRNRYGQPLAAMLVNYDEDNRLEFTHAGWSNPGAHARSGLRRVAYGVKDGALHRTVWYHLDRAPETEAMDSPMLIGVDSLGFRFLDGNRKWQTKWPVLNEDQKILEALPLAIEVSIELRDKGKIKRLFRVAG